VRKGRGGRRPILCHSQFSFLIILFNRDHEDPAKTVAIESQEDLLTERERVTSDINDETKKLISLPVEPRKTGEVPREDPEPQEVVMLNAFQPGLIHEDRFFHFWREELKANNWVLNTLKKGYMIPFGKQRPMEINKR